MTRNPRFNLDLLSSVCVFLDDDDKAVLSKTCRALHEEFYGRDPQRFTLSLDRVVSSIDVLKWAARENGCPWDEATCHLEVLKWARENGCPWDEWTCSNAAKGGHLEVLKWARENGCPE
jgi:hypothetical protein